MTLDYIGLEVDTPTSRAMSLADIFYDGHVLPFEDNRFDVVLCNEVLEHVFEVNEFLSEIRRVLKPGGRLILTVPFVWDEHEQPRDCARYSSFGLRYLLEYAGFQIELQEKTVPDIRVLFQLWNAYIVKAVYCGKKSRIRLALALLLSLPFNVIGQCMFRVLPSNPDLFLDNAVLARKLKCS